MDDAGNLLASDGLVHCLPVHSQEGCGFVNGKKLGRAASGIRGGVFTWERPSWGRGGRRRTGRRRPRPTRCGVCPALATWPTRAGRAPARHSYQRCRGLGTVNWGVWGSHRPKWVRFRPVARAALRHPRGPVTSTRHISISKPFKKRWGSYYGEGGAYEMRALGYVTPQHVDGRIG